jgi:F-BAR domain only protein
MPYNRSGSPERKHSHTNLGASLFGKGRRKEQPESGEPSSPSRRLSETRPQTTGRPSDVSGSPKQSRQSNEKSGAPAAETSADAGASTELTNGTESISIPQLQEPLQPTPATVTSPEVQRTRFPIRNSSLHCQHELTDIPQPQKDSEGFQIPPSTGDAISEAEREATA